MPIQSLGYLRKMLTLLITTRNSTEDEQQAGKNLTITDIRQHTKNCLLAQN